ncbi:mesoderm induction early response protein [Carex rostrata]
MSDNEKGVEGSTSKEPDWDMLSLSSSTYTDKEPATESLFMSGHFVFPPSEHENLPIEPESTEPESELEQESVIAPEEEQPRESIEYQSSPEGIKFFEEGQRVTIHDSDEEETGNSLVDDNGTKNDGNEEKALPCGAWWKRHAVCLYKNVKEANTIWSVLVATALMGLVVLGQRWHKEKWQMNSRWRFHINNEMTSKILGSKQ